jgi:hypothetical protein
MQVVMENVGKKGLICRIKLSVTREINERSESGQFPDSDRAQTGPDHDVAPHAG